MYSLPDESIAELIETYYQQFFSGVHDVAALFPLPFPDDFSQLCTSIANYGLNNPIKRHRITRQLLDGRSRLLACYVTGIDPRVEDVEPIDLVDYSIAENLARRHLTVSQKAAAAVMAMPMYEAEAKARQVAATVRGNTTRHQHEEKEDSPVEVNLPQLAAEREPQARDKAAAAFGVGGSYVGRAKAISEHAPETFEELKSGAKTVNEAYKEAKPKIERAKASERLAKADDSDLTTVITTDGKTAPILKVAKPVFNKTNDSVSWAGYTWNPVTGCEHGCEFCYAREIAISERMKPFYPLGFTPVFHEQRLSAPVNTKPDGRVFVCSMADLFGKWVPDEWIRKVFDACMAAPDWEYMFLTKWPKRYQLLADLPKAAFGASIIRQADVNRVERDMAAFETTGKKWISLEPMLGPIKFNDLSWCDMVVIGAQTETNQPGGVVPSFAPEFDWVFDVVAQCRSFGVKYYLKPNLLNVKPRIEIVPGMVLPQPDI